MKKALFIIIFAILSALAAVLYSYRGYQSAVVIPSGTANGQVEFVVEPGDSAEDIGKHLEKLGLVSASWHFTAYSWQNGFSKRYQAGTYKLDAPISIRELAAVFIRGDSSSKEREIRIIEGWNLAEIADYLERSGAADGGTFLSYAQKPLDGWELPFTKPGFLKDAPGTATLEGYLFPDTYRIFKDAAPEEILAKLLNNFDRELTPEMRSDAQAQGRSIHEIVTMASLIEKEVRSQEDMRIVSGIFWKRINNGQRLESCATLAFILGKNKEQYSLEDTRIDSPYNTYRNAGLPPGPIANPGFAALKAAVYPENTDYNYFLTSAKTGKTIFSRTFEEHVANKAIHL